MIFQRDIERAAEMKEKTGEFPEVELVLDDVKGVGLLYVSFRWNQTMCPGGM